MITIENKEDIELLLLFFEQFDLSHIYEECELESSDNPQLRKKDLDNHLNGFKNEVCTVVLNMLEDKWESYEKRLNEKLTEHGVMIENAIASKYLTETPKKTGSTGKRKRGKKDSKAPLNDKCIREYSMTCHDRLHSIIRVDKHGRLYSRTRELGLTIFDLKRLEKLIPDLDLSFEDLAEKFGIHPFQMRIYCYGLEIGHYKKWWDEWNSKYNTVEKPSVPIINNPEKRKELIGMG